MELRTIDTLMSASALNIAAFSGLTFSGEFDGDFTQER